MDPGIAGRDFDTMLGMLANGDAAVLHHGRLDDRHLQRRRLQLRRGLRLRSRPRPTGASPASSSTPNSVVFFEQKDPDYIEGQTLLATLILSPEFQTVFNQAKGSIPARHGRRPQPRASTPASRSSRTTSQASIEDGTLVRSMAHNMTVLQKIPRRDDGHHHRVRELGHVARGRRQPAWPTRSKRRCRQRTRPGAVVAASAASAAPARAMTDLHRTSPARPPPGGPARGLDAASSCSRRRSSRASSTSSSSRSGRFYISLSNSTLLPTYGFVGFEQLRRALVEPALEHRLHQPVHLQRASTSSARWRSGCLLAILIDQRVRGESGLAHDLPLPARGLLRRHRHGLELALQPDRRHRVPGARASAGRASPSHWTTDRDFAIYAVVITGIWQASGFAMALFLAGLRSVDGDLVKAAQIDGAGDVPHLSQGDPADDRADLHRRRR